MKISIITISFNSEATIEETIKSVIHQNYLDLEYIIIDGGSTDKTIEIINKYKNNIACFISEPDKGIADAFNKGIKRATGEIIGIINSDDKLFNNALNVVKNNFHVDSDILYGNLLILGKESRSLSIKYPKNNIEVIKYEMINTIYHPSTFIRKNAYVKYGLYDINCKSAMDWELLLRMYVSGAKFQYCNSTLACFRLGGFSGNDNGLGLKEGREFCKKYKGNIVAIYYFYYKNELKRRVWINLNKAELLKKFLLK